MVRSHGILIGLFLATTVCGAESLPSIDFRHAAETPRWRPVHDLGDLASTPEGMRFDIRGADPYCHGPALDFPRGVPLLMRVRLRSETGGTCQVFYFQRNTREEDSVRFAVREGDWNDVVVPLPPLDSGYHLRIDPPGTSGAATIEKIVFEPRVEIATPAWPSPTVPELSDQAPQVVVGELAIRHGAEWGAFEVSWEQQRLACGFNRPWIGYQHEGQVRWLDVQKLSKVAVKNAPGSLVVTATLSDPDGADWELSQHFRAGDQTVEVETRCAVSRTRSLVYLPLLLLTPGLGTTGEAKSQALLAGVEYLENEPSSSKADMNPPASERRVPDLLKLTMPLMVVQHDGHYVGLSWEESPETAALFDSPDRVFRGGAHVCGVIAPGSDGRFRGDGDLFPFSTPVLAPETPLVSRATIWAGRGATVVPAIQRYVARRGLPPRPAMPTLAEYAERTAASWLTTEIRDGNRFRHAVGGSSFPAHPAADAAWQIDWLSTSVPDRSQATELRKLARAAAAEVPPAGLVDHAVGHVRYPVAPLLYGHLPENLAAARERTRHVLARFDADGRVRYRAHPGREDYGRTHWSDEANGLTATLVDQALETACFAGDRTLIEQSLAVLRKLPRQGRTVPRGAQTWEIPLHTPDILASAHLVRAFVRGYELTSEPAMLEEAIYWAWTGVPFVYLRQPADGPVGPYSTIAVLGATNWVAPVWLGLPVQWCGLVYADAIRRLAPYDQPAFWNQLADGIALSGVQQVYPPSHPRRGLLPDSFSLRAQQRNPADINPGTLFPTALPAYQVAVPYSFRVARESNLLIHVPGTLQELSTASDRCQFEVRSWFPDPFRIVVHGFQREPKVRIDGSDIPPGETWTFLPETGTVIVTCRDATRIELVQ